MTDTTSGQPEEHDIAVVRAENGELIESSPHRERSDAPRRGEPRPAGSGGAGEVDETSDESFPASDAPSSWAGGTDEDAAPEEGGAQRRDPGGSGPRHRRITGGRPLEDGEELAVPPREDYPPRSDA